MSNLCRSSVIAWVVVFLSVSNVPAEKKVRNGVLGFVAGTAATYLILKANNIRDNYSPTARRYHKRSEGQMVAFGAGVGTGLGFLAYMLTPERSDLQHRSLIGIGKGKIELNVPYVRYIVREKQAIHVKLVTISL